MARRGGMLSWLGLCGGGGEGVIVLGEVKAWLRVRREKPSSAVPVCSPRTGG